MFKRRILGIDPGLASTGWGIIDVENNRLKCVDYGTIETAATEEKSVRLLFIYNSLLQVVQTYKPTETAMEALYFAKNVTSGLVVAESRGVVTLCFAQHALSLSEYSPLTVKQSVVGSSKATKKMVQEYVKLLLGLQVIPKPDHAADALAVAISHAHHKA